MLHDVPEVLRSIGTTVEGDLRDERESNSDDLLRKFKTLPKMHRGRDVTLEFTMSNCRAVSADECEALRLEAGATINQYAKLLAGDRLNIYASNELAENIFDISKLL